MYVRVNVSLYHSRGKQEDSFTSLPLYSGETTTGMLFTGIWMDPRASLDVTEENISRSCQESSLDSSVAQNTT
jgi:hypothetical protein